MKKSPILALAIVLASGGTVLAQSGTDSGSAPGGPPSSPTATSPAPSMPGPMPRDSGSSMGSGTISPPRTTAPSTTSEPSTAVPPSIATNPPAAAMPNTGAPRGGRGEAQARARIEADGYRNIGPLTRGPDGLWRGTAMRGAASVNVMVDARGNVMTQ